MPTYRVLARERINGYPHPRMDATHSHADWHAAGGLLATLIEVMYQLGLSRMAVAQQDWEYQLWESTSCDCKHDATLASVPPIEWNEDD